MRKRLRKKRYKRLGYLIPKAQFEAEVLEARAERERSEGHFFESRESLGKLLEETGLKL